MKKAIFKTWILAATWLFIGPQNLYAGNEGSGGGHVVDHELYDFYLQDHKINVTDLEAFRVVVAPVLEKIGGMIIGFREKLEGAIHDKDWYIETKPLKCPFEGMLQVRAWPAACQDTYVIRLADRLLKNESVQTQGRVILHELVRAVASQKGLGDDAIYYLTPVLMSAENADELNSSLDRFGFGSYMKVSDYETISQEMARLKDLVAHASDCSQPSQERSVRVETARQAISAEIKKIAKMENLSALSSHIREVSTDYINILMSERLDLDLGVLHCNFSGR